MTVATIQAATVVEASHRRPLGHLLVSVAATVVTADGNHRTVRAEGDAAYVLRRNPLRVTGRGRWLQVPLAPVRSVVVDGEIVAIRSPEGASEDVQLALDSLVLSVHEVAS